MVRDPQNAIGYDIVNIEAIPTSPPVVQILEPLPIRRTMSYSCSFRFRRDNEDVNETIFHIGNQMSMNMHIRKCFF